MSTRTTVYLAALGLFSAANAHAQELWNRTTAEATEAGPRQVSVVVESRFEFVSERVPDLQESDIIATWQRVGGVQPTPFRIVIPAGCFVEQRDRLRISGTTCGVQVILNGETVWRNEKVYPNFHVREVISEDERVVLVVHKAGRYQVELSA